MTNVIPSVDRRHQIRRSRSERLEGYGKILIFSHTKVTALVAQKQTYYSFHLDASTRKYSRGTIKKLIF